MNRKYYPIMFLLLAALAWSCSSSPEQLAEVIARKKCECDAINVRKTLESERKLLNDLKSGKFKNKQEFIAWRNNPARNDQIAEQLERIENEFLKCQEVVDSITYAATKEYPGPDNQKKIEDAFQTTYDVLHKDFDKPYREIADQISAQVSRLPEY